LPEEPAADKHAQREGRTHAAHPAKPRTRKLRVKLRRGRGSAGRGKCSGRRRAASGEPVAVPPAAWPSAAESPSGTVGERAAAPPPRAVMGGAVAVGPDNTIIPVQPGSMPGAAALLSTAACRR
jgi:hypothetical protein